MVKKILLGLAVLLAVVFVGILALGRGWFGEHEGPGTSSDVPRPAEVIEAATATQQAAGRWLGIGEPKQILFGDLHVHTTFSTDAFMISLPPQGEGAHPPADACDFARYCSALDFWSINDHAEGLTPQHWRETVDSIRQCNATAGDPDNPDLVSFLGWEWTQVGVTPDTHYGHKNVVLADLESDKIPTRPIASGGLTRQAMAVPPVHLRALLALAGRDERFSDLNRYFQERAGRSVCEDGVPVRELPDDCTEFADTPKDLFRKLDEWGHRSIVIPHGTTWGFYTPPGSTWDKQLTSAQNDPDRQTLVEIFSGHGNSEEYRDWRAVRFDANGNALCPEPTEDYTASCWRAGEIIQQRCTEAGFPESECEARAKTARSNAAAAGVAGHHTVSGESPDDWLDAGQCRDCFQPAFNYRPGGSVQYMMALGNFDDPGQAPKRFRFGFMGSSDNHWARPGTGYKEFSRIGMTESRDGAPGFLATPPGEPLAESVPFDPLNTKLAGFQLVEFERQASFFLAGGLVAAHASSRSREDIWEALDRKEVYGTSGPRMLLWFDLVNAPRSKSVPMGGAAAMKTNPRFVVRAVGSFEQKPGCPEYTVRGLSEERIGNLCHNDCYHPSDRRRAITRVEVVRIRPQTRPDEPVAGLIQDPWRVYECAPNPAGCTISFEDPQYKAGQRDSVYYVRAIEAATPAINADNLRCERDESGNCTKVHRCGTDATLGDDCLADTEERAWSSPIFVDWSS